jgi:hypothetical protein
MTGEQWIPIEAVMRLLKVSNANARQLARRYGWQRITLRGRAHYLISDVVNTPRRGGP